MKKILLFADIGGHEYDQYYHVGDEAMFLETYRWYKLHRKEWKLSAFSWFQTHGDLDLTEVPHLHWPQHGSKFYFLKMIAKILLYRFFAVDRFSAAEKSYVEIICEHDVIHFTGGGNLSSIFRTWLYYAFTIMCIAKLWRKKIILTSQTIGPITGIDWLISRIFLNFPEVIGLRHPLDNRTTKSMKWIISPAIISMIDAAYTFTRNLDMKSIRSKKEIRIGLSVHAWKGYEEKTVRILKDCLQQLRRDYAIKITIIPHDFVSTTVSRDAQFMDQIVPASDARDLLYQRQFEQRLIKGSSPVSVVRSMTSQIDVLITSRYHGLIFALSQAVPTVVLAYDDYYLQKHSSALKMVYGHSQYDNHVQVHQSNASISLCKKTQYYLDHLGDEKMILIQRNKTLPYRYPSTHGILNKYYEGQR